MFLCNSAVTAGLRGPIRGIDDRSEMQVNGGDWQTGAGPSQQPSPKVSRSVSCLLVCIGLAEMSGATSAACSDWRSKDTNASPSPRYTAMAYDSDRGVTVLFGGSDGSLLADTWEWNGTFWVEIHADGPSPREGHAMVYDNDRGVVVLHGGAVGSTGLTDTWEWDGMQWTEVDISGPGGLVGHAAAMTYDSARKVVLLCNRGETWEWDGMNWTLVSNDSSDPSVYGASMVFDEKRGVAVLFGGLYFYPNTFEVSGDTWEWDGMAWTEVATTGPAPRWLAGAAYDKARGTFIVFSGFTSSNLVYTAEDTWEWNGTMWKPLATAGPAPRGFPAMAYDIAHAQTVLFGGWESQVSGNYFDDTWVTEFAVPIITEQPVDVAAVEGGPAGFGVGAVADAPVSYQWYASDSPIPGATRPFLLFDHVSLADESDSYYVRITGLCDIAESDPVKLRVIPRADLDSDGDVDLADHGMFSMAFTGPLP